MSRLRIDFPEHVQHVAFAGDWHGNASYAGSVIEALPAEVEAILHTGDFGYNFTSHFLNTLTDKAAKHDKIIMFCAGNHDNYDYLETIPVDDDGVQRLTERIWHLPRAFRWEWFGLKFLALGGAHSIDRLSRKQGISWWPQEWINHRDMYAAIEGGDVDIMLTHDAPAGHHIPGLLPEHLIPEDDLRYADQHREIIKFVVQEVNARWLWHGHYHSFYRVESGNTVITGLDCDGSQMYRNVDVVDLAEFALDI